MSPVIKGLTCQNRRIFCRGKLRIGRRTLNLGSVPFHENESDVDS